MTVLIIVLWAFLIAYGLYELIIRIMAKRAAKTLEEEEFRENMRTAQVIDLREKDAFDSGHIMGARNIPYSQLKQSFGSIRKDRPVYLYDQKRAMSIRGANRLKKNGYTDLYILKGGYAGWTGKIKKKERY
jgi:rhodanese-related sulfurtransferase